MKYWTYIDSVLHVIGLKLQLKQLQSKQKNYFWSKVEGDVVTEIIRFDFDHVRIWLGQKYTVKNNVLLDSWMEILRYPFDVNTSIIIRNGFFAAYNNLHFGQCQ